jgi:hypothetical protein
VAKEEQKEKKKVEGKLNYATALLLFPSLAKTAPNGKKKKRATQKTNNHRKKKRERKKKSQKGEEEERNKPEKVPTQKKKKKKEKPNHPTTTKDGHTRVGKSSKQKQKTAKQGAGLC